LDKLRTYLILAPELEFRTEHLVWGPQVDVLPSTKFKRGLFVHIFELFRLNRGGCDKMDAGSAATN
jgi:hypothetical protein